MKLVTFNNNIAFNELHKKMGSSPAEFSISTWNQLDENQILTRLNSHEGIEVDFDEVKTCSDGTFEFKGKKVLIYIRDQYISIQQNGEYKFHISNCDTIDRQKRRTFGSRYVVSTRTDGHFLINEIDKTTNIIVQENIIKEMKVCKNCLKQLSYKGYNNHYRDVTIYNMFKLSEFFELYPSSSINPLPKHSEIDAPKNIYSDNWVQISQQYREEKNWRCEECKEDYKNNRSQLDVHHIDGVKSNNNPNNLKALCKSCHTKLHNAI